ncbi:hypothetical protein B4U79_05172 [Dinothrombium tinctorium]|uniref:Uncharacterized protein n=1 Tax=Dinothrombium tinctorium TaxID=1965070 RepID=A0A3S3PIQ4_9ACAR|nr:hypothetical protein B4U79_05172 [Dinothrombium tinctorium]
MIIHFHHLRLNSKQKFFIQMLIAIGYVL